MSTIILAGGNSSRMGRDKAFLALNGTSFIENLIYQVRGVFSEVIISASVPGNYEHLRCRVVMDEKPGLGPLMGILSGLKASRTHSNFVTACDIPRIDIGFLKKMISISAGYDILIPRYRDGKYEPLFGIYTKSVIPLIEKQIESRDPKIVLIFPLCHTGFIDMDHENWYKNINTFEEYKDLIS